MNHFEGMFQLKVSNDWMNYWKACEPLHRRKNGTKSLEKWVKTLKELTSRKKDITLTSLMTRITCLLGVSWYQVMVAGGWESARQEREITCFISAVMAMTMSFFFMIVSIIPIVDHHHDHPDNHDHHDHLDPNLTAPSRPVFMPETETELAPSEIFIG